ncbi:MAG: hypothetical protein AB2693_19860, partial [Candidatus Thiodiazotropha sp.]
KQGTFCTTAQSQFLWLNKMKLVRKAEHDRLILIAVIERDMDFDTFPHIFRHVSYRIMLIVGINFLVIGKRPFVLC